MSGIYDLIQTTPDFKHRQFQNSINSFATGDWNFFFQSPNGTIVVDEKIWFIKLSPQSKIQTCKALMMSICSKYIPSLSNNQLWLPIYYKKAKSCFLSIGLGTECWQDLKSVVNYIRPITNSGWWLSIFYCTDKQLLLILTLYSVEWYLPRFFQAFLLVWQIFFNYQVKRGTMKAKILSQRRDIMIMCCFNLQFTFSNSLGIFMNVYTFWRLSVYFSSSSSISFPLKTSAVKYLMNDSSEIKM